MDAAGNIYGTTSQGGAYDFGIVYKIDTAGHFSVLYSFAGGADGGFPIGGVTVDGAGSIYGTTASGGTGSVGVVFKLDTSGHETVLHTFTGGPDGASPDAAAILDSSGNLYGTASLGGTLNLGVVFKIDSTGKYTVLHNFGGTGDGIVPYAPLIRDAQGDLFGTTTAGGPANAGVVFKIDASGNESVLYAFQGGLDGGVPYAPLIVDHSGNLYGTTSQGGPGNVGVVFRVDPTGHEKVLYSWPGAPTGSWPEAGLIRDAKGNLYGTAYSGGAGNSGAVFKLSPQRQETVLYSFRSGLDGESPVPA